jgi:adenylate cyclase class 2
MAKETEIELQASVENVKPLKDLLEKEGEFQYERHQIDEYFTPIHRDFIAAKPTHEWLRLRDADGHCSFNYKNWHFDDEGRGLYADEFETKIEDLVMARKILTAIDVKPVVIVDKVRKTWRYKDYEICLDSVKNLGDFVEIEYMGKKDPSEHKNIMAEMTGFLKGLGCGRIEINHSGYPALLLFGHEGRFDVI